MAEEKKDLTVYQKLFYLFGQAGGPKSNITNSKYALTDNDLIVTQSKQEFNKEKLQLQQQKYLEAQWAKVDNEKSVFYETSRLASYMDYEAMEFTPEIAVALDIMSEESCTLNEQGRIMSVQSDSSRIKKVLEDLFFNVLDIHSNLPMWTRNTCKYGDNFIYLKIDYKDGIVGASQLTNIDIERKETGLFPYQQQGLEMDESGDTKKREVSFVWRDKTLEFNAWEIGHFRLLGDDRKIPYGTSVLEKVRRIWKQLLLAEDAMLVYRVTRAPERRVFKVYVGNIDDEDVESYVQKVANKFKRTQQTDNQTGQTDVRYNTLAVDQDYFVPVRDPNASMPIETLPGASNLDQIADIQFIQRKMVTALRVPKTFLGFEEPTGEGKNLALMDIRFARTINRIQQAMIQELNKIAIIHLYILGFHDELNNFKLTLNNPSTQGEMLKVEQWKEKVLLYKDLVGGVDGGIAPTSHTWAKKNIFNWSEDEIKLDLEQQRLERAASAELEQTPNIIKNTGFFKKVDKLYGEILTDTDTDTSDDAGVIWVETQEVDSVETQEVDSVETQEVDSVIVVVIWVVMILVDSVRVLEVMKVL